MNLQVHRDLGHFGLTWNPREERRAGWSRCSWAGSVQGWGRDGGRGGPERLDSERERPRPAEEVCRGESRQAPLIYHRHRMPETHLSLALSISPVRPSRCMETATKPSLSLVLPVSVSGWSQFSDRHASLCFHEADGLYICLLLLSLCFFPHWQLGHRISWPKT